MLSAALRICARGIHKVKDAELRVTPYSVEMDPERFLQAKQRTIRVLFPPGCNEEALEMYFESKKCSGGGEIEKISIDIAKSCANITFSDADGRQFS